MEMNKSPEAADCQRGRGPGGFLQPLMTQITGLIGDTAVEAGRLMKGYKGYE